jgi:type IV pilus assembly protein PilC
MVVQMIAVGEQTAELGRMMTYVGEHFEREIDTSLDVLTSIIEPILIVFIGLCIGGILMAMYLPMFDLINVVG